MYIPEDIIQEIADKTDMEDIVGSYVNLKKTGRNLTGLCPFHTEKTPSFTVTPDKGMFYCYGCRKGGNIFNFIMEIEKLTFPEAVQFLADKAGVRLDLSADEGVSAENVFRKQLSDLYEKLSITLNYILKEKSISSVARGYLAERGVSEESIERFRIGYIPPDRKWLYSFLRNKSYSREFLSKSALFSSRYPEISIFSGRVMFPIFSRTNQVIAFGGRSLGDAIPKYINSPETPIFRKSSELYGFSHARKEIREKDSVFIVEGYMDVIAMFQAGVENCIAPLGTAFTESHASVVRKNCSKVVLVFDGDEAGLKATVRSAYICENAALDCSVVVLPEKSDPADILKKLGPEALKNILKYPINCFDFLINKYKDIYDISKEEGIKGFLERVFAFVALQDSQVRRAGRLKTIAEILNTDYKPVNDDFIRYLNKKDRGTFGTGAAVPGGKQLPPELYLMFAVIDNYDYFYLIREELPVDEIQDRAARDIYIILEECYRNNSFSPEYVLERIDNSELKNLLARKLSSEEFSVNSGQLIEESIKTIKLKNLHAKRVQIEKTISRDDGSDPYRLEDLIAEKLFLDKEIEKLKGTNSNV